MKLNRRSIAFSSLVIMLSLCWAGSVYAVTPVLQCTPAGFTNTVSYGQTQPDQSFYVSNVSTAPVEVMAFTVTTNASWMSVAPVSGTSQGESKRIDILYNLNGVAPGVHTGMVSVTASGAMNSPRRVWVYMRINNRPGLKTDAVTFSNTITQGHSLSNESFEVWNNSGIPYATMGYSISNSASWFTTTITNQTSQGEQDRVELIYNTTGLLPGTHTGMVTITATDQATGLDATNSPIVIPVTLNINGLPTLGLTPLGMTNSVLQNVVATSKTFTVWNAATNQSGALNYTLSESETWFDLSATSGSSTGEIDTITVSFNSAVLTTGSYSGTITVTGTDSASGEDAFESPQTITVDLTVRSRRPVNLEAPQILGVPKIGNKLRIDRGVWSPTGYLDFQYQWQRADNLAGNNVQDIVGSIGTNYNVTEQDRGKFLRVKVSATDSRAQPSLTTHVFTDFSSGLKVKAIASDYDGDGMAETWFYDTCDGLFRMKLTTGGSVADQFGWCETEPVCGDYDGDGIEDLVVYHRSAGTWYILTSSGQFRTRQFGWSAANPVTGDFDGDGVDDLALYYPAGGTWYIWTDAGEFSVHQFGWSETVPVPGDYDSDGKTDLAVYYQPAGMWYLLESSTGVFRKQQFGWSETLPAQGDYDGDGVTDYGVYYQAGNVWYVMASGASAFTQYGPFGTSTGNGIPVPGFYDVDELCDPATAHIHGDFIVWCIQGSTNGYYGCSYKISEKRWR